MITLGLLNYASFRTMWVCLPIHPSTTTKCTHIQAHIFSTWHAFLSTLLLPHDQMHAYIHVLSNTHYNIQSSQTTSHLVFDTLVAFQKKRKWEGIEEIERNRGNGEGGNLSLSPFPPSLHFFSISSFSLHFLILSSFPFPWISDSLIHMLSNVHAFVFNNFSWCTYIIIFATS